MLLLSVLRTRHPKSFVNKVSADCERAQIETKEVRKEDLACE